MTEHQKMMDWVRYWVRYYGISAKGYQWSALTAVLRNDGEKMLEAVLKELKLTNSLDLIKDVAKKQ